MPENGPISGFTELAEAPAVGDQLAIVDVSDTTDTAQGTTKKIKVENLNGVLYQNSQSANYTLLITDRGKHIYHPTSDDNPRTWTIPANSSVAFPVGTVITFVNDQNTITIAITTDALVWAEDGSTGSRTLAENGICTALKVTSTRWIISGVGLS